MPSEILTEKTCKSCKKIKPCSKFNKHSLLKDGLNTRCKKCVRTQGIEKNRTEHGCISRILSRQKGKSKKRGHLPPAYSKKQLTKWIYDNGFKKIYDKWVSSGYDIYLKTFY